MRRPRLLRGGHTALPKVVVALCAMEFLEWMGGGAIIPLLPTYLRQHGSSIALVGVVMGSYFAASMLTQYPLGRLADRLGPRPVILGGLALFVLGCVGFALVPGALAGIAFRALQGTGAGSATVAGAATIGYVVPSEERGAAFGALYASQTLALAIGPLVGSVIGTASMRWLFLAAALAAGSAALPALGYLPHDGPHLGQPRQRRGFAQRALSPGMLGATAVFVATGLLGGMYESCWSLLLHLRGASSIAIGLSWTLYCLPFAALSLSAGRLADRADRRTLAAVGICVSAVFACIYPLLHSVVLLVCVGCFEAVGAVLVTPAALSVLSSSVAHEDQGAAQGFIGTARTGATALAAAGCGALFALSPRLAFDVTGGVLALLAATVLVLWRQLPGRVQETGDLQITSGTPELG